METAGLVGTHKDYRTDGGTIRWERGEVGHTDHGYGEETWRPQDWWEHAQSALPGGRGAFSACSLCP